MSVAVAFRSFFAALFNNDRAEAIRHVLDGDVVAERLEQPKPAAEPAMAKTAVGKTAAATTAAKPTRSDALTLLATLQREARLVDLVQEPLDQYSDAQVGAAARPCLMQCRSTLKRMFDLRPLVESQEGQTVDVPQGASPLRYQWVGEGATNRGSGQLVHPGWQATRCEIAQWTGEATDSRVVAPAQLE
jgi:hypothetical protein